MRRSYLGCATFPWLGGILPRTDDAAVAAAEADIEAGLLPKLAAAEDRARALAAPPPLPELDGVDVGARWDELPVATQRDVVRLLMDITVMPSARRGARLSGDRLHITWRS